MKPSHILDESKENISFAFSMRILESDYEGPIIRLRRSNDNDIKDFSWGENDIVDIDAINAWRGGNTVFVVQWFDQSGLNRHAIQTVANLQPQFMPNAFRPYLVGDGLNDRLIVSTGTQTITQQGKNGSVFGVFLATDRADSAFGVINGSNGSDRWLTHINWNNERCYFDPGFCCVNVDTRSFINNLPNATNPGSLGIWDQYSFIRRDNPLDTNNDRIILRLGGTEESNDPFADNLRCTIDYNFGICAIINNTTNNAVSFSNTRIQEIIMYAEGKNDFFINEIETNQISFWNL